MAILPPRWRASIDRPLALAIQVGLSPLCVTQDSVCGIHEPRFCNPLPLSSGGLHQLRQGTQMPHGSETNPPPSVAVSCADFQAHSVYSTCLCNSSWSSALLLSCMQQETIAVHCGG